MSARASLLTAAREWVAECSWRDVHGDDDVAELSEGELIRGIRRHYAGGWRGLADDSLLSGECVALARKWDGGLVDAPEQP